MKIMKSIPSAIAATAILLASTTIATTTFAETKATTGQEQVQPPFIEVTGTIESEDVRDNGSYYSIKNDEEIHHLVVTSETLVFDNTGKKVDMNEGDKITAYTFANKPMIFIYPPQYNPEVVIVETEAASMAAVGTFDKHLLDNELSLELNVNEDTDLSSLSGNTVKMDDLKEQHLLVFYTATTRSIPAQTSPHKVVLLDQHDSNHKGLTNPTVDEIIAKDFYDVDRTKMVPLRLIAEELGYKVLSTGKGAILTKGALSFTLTRGELAYGYNKSLRYFDVAPDLLEPGKTYVPVQFIEELTEER